VLRLGTAYTLPAAVAGHVDFVSPAARFPAPVPTHQRRWQRRQRREQRRQKQQQQQRQQEEVEEEAAAALAAAQAAAPAAAHTRGGRRAAAGERAAAQADTPTLAAAAASPSSLDLAEQLPQQHQQHQQHQQPASATWCRASRGFPHQSHAQTMRVADWASSNNVMNPLRLRAFYGVPAAARSDQCSAWTVEGKRVGGKGGKGKKPTTSSDFLSDACPNGPTVQFGQAATMYVHSLATYQY
jgi:hypothetical protein